MGIELFDQPINYGRYLLVGTCRTCPIYVGPVPTKEWVALATYDGRGVSVNKKAFDALRKSPRFAVFLENICEHELSNDPCHEHTGIRPESEQEVIQYLREQGILE